MSSASIITTCDQSRMASIFRPAFASSSRSVIAREPALHVSRRQRPGTSTLLPAIRTLQNSAQRPAEVADVDVGSSSRISASDSEAKPLSRPSHTSREALAAKREEKFAKYAALLKDKAHREGFQSVDEMREKHEERKAIARATEKAAEASRGWESASAGPTSSASQPQSPSLDSSGLSEADAKVAADIRARIEAEARRKVETGDFSSGPSGVKTLKDIIDVERIAADDPAKISQLWTQYHTLKSKLSAVIPAKQYAEMVAKARQYPQFLLPLPRTITGTLGGETANVAPGERKEGYEMQYMEWGFLPKPSPIKAAPPADDGAAPISPLPAAEAMSDSERELVARAPPSTVLFTPLAEYKLRQEFAQPVLIVSHFTELALSKGIVLLRGDVTGAEEAAVAPTGIAAAAAAAKAGETSAEKLEALQKPLQSQGRLSQQDAQLLTVMLQRFYMPKAEGVGPQPGESERQMLLEAFHNDQDSFDVDSLCKSATVT